MAAHFRRFAALAAALVTSHCIATAQADVLLTDWTYLSDLNPSGSFFERAPGPDFLFGTADDLSAPGENTRGNASYSEETNTPSAEFTAFLGGTISTRQDSETGAYTFETSDSAGTFDCTIAFCGIEYIDALAGPFKLTTFPGPTPGPSVNAGIEFPNQTGGFEVDGIDTSNDNVFRSTGSTWTLYRGDDLAALAATFGPDVMAHFGYVINSGALPTDWQAVRLMLYDFLTIDGPNAGFAGRATVTLYAAADDVRTETVSGSVRGISPNIVVCQNLTTGTQIPISIPPGTRTWDCTAAGLVVNPGDTVVMIEAGVAP